MATPIGTLGTIPTLTVAGRVFTDLTTLITLHAIAGGSNYATFRLPNGTSGYQVTTGKTYTVYAAKTYLTAAAGWTSMTIGYGDNDVGQTSAAAPTNLVVVGGSTTIPLVAAASPAEAPTKFNIPALKYPALVNVSATGAGVIHGYEA